MPISFLLLDYEHRNMSSHQKPNVELCVHLSHKERMIAGFPYNAADSALRSEKCRAKQLLKRYIEVDADNELGRQEILKELLNPACQGKKITIKPPFHIDYGYNLTAGDELYVNVGCVFLDAAPITFGNDCLVGPGVHIYAATHPIQAKYRRNTDEKYYLAKPVKIGNDVWIGGKAVICPGITIGDNVVVGAGAVVTKDVPSNCIVGGNPAKIIRSLDAE